VDIAKFIELNLRNNLDLPVDFNIGQPFHLTLPANVNLSSAPTFPTEPKKTNEVKRPMGIEELSELHRSC